MADTTYSDQQTAIQMQFLAQQQAADATIQSANATVRAKSLQGNDTFAGSAAPAPKAVKGGKRGK